MKRFPQLVLVAVHLVLGLECALAEDAATKASQVGILPDFKKGVVVSTEERNPYAVLAAPKQQAVATGVEGAKLTAILEALPVSGVAKDKNGKVTAVLLGDLRLEGGAPVPHLLEGQTDELVVQSVNAEEVVIAWRLEAGRTVSQPRVLRKKIDLSPKVEALLPGQIGLESTKNAGSRKSSVLVRGKTPLPSKIVPTSGLPEAAP
jgi:hypothetical protein